ncbi:minichromosome maintenance protein 10 [Trichomonascus vanleenenianus]|uniref:Mcm10p n=1 Tax=Trichomonascus vanleenenianus TaxID=2268995 RepID=UPI003ECA2867
MADSDNEQGLLKQLAEIKAKLKNKRDKSAGPTTPKKSRGIVVHRTPSPPPLRKSPNKSPARVLLGLEKKTSVNGVKLSRPKPQHTKVENVKPETSLAQQIRQKRQNQVESQHQAEVLKKDRIKSFSKTNVGENEKAVKLAGEDFSYEKYTKLRLIRRFMDENAFEAELEDKKILLINQVFAEVTPPDYMPPSYPNFIVMGVVARKSKVKQNKFGHKFIMITLTDLVYDISLAIHGEAFEKYWKVQDGTLIAILNPEVYTTKTEAGAVSFGLSLNCEDDVMLEVGRAKDFGYCQANTKSGNRCTQWINTAKNIYCEYHVELGVKRTGRKRQEVNAAPTKMFSPKKNGQRMQFAYGGTNHTKGKTGLLPEGPQLDRLSGGGLIYTSSSVGHTKRGFDTQDMLSQKNAEEQRAAKRMKSQQKEQLIRQQLAKRPEAYLMREYNEKGLAVDEQDYDKADSDKPRLFTPETVRKIGFDPTKRLLFESKAKDTRIERVDASKVKLSKAKTVTLESDSSSDELEII